MALNIKCLIFDFRRKQMSICEYSVNMKNKCGNCKDFKLYDKTGI